MNVEIPLVALVPFYSAGVALTLIRFWPGLRSSSIQRSARVGVVLLAFVWPMAYLMETAAFIDERAALRRAARREDAS